MPELPEVTTVIRGLSKYLPGQTVKNVEILKSRSFLWNVAIKKPDLVNGLKVVTLSRRGKGIIINLRKPGIARKGEDWSLLIHLKMTGQLIYVPSSRHAELVSASDHKTLKPVHPKSISETAQGPFWAHGGEDGRLNFGHPDDNFLATMPSRHTRVIIELSKGTLYFNDQRLFGWVKLTPTDEIANDPFIRKLGPEPLTSDFNPEMFWTILKRRPNSNIKSIILDQSVTSGVGNIYADESLFTARIRPTRLAKNITKPEATKLVTATKDALKMGIKYSGTSMSHYKTGEGASGKMQNYLKMYGRKDQPCPVCGNPIHKIRTAGRGTHYCPTCQK